MKSLKNLEKIKKLLQEIKNSAEKCQKALHECDASEAFCGCGADICANEIIFLTDKIEEEINFFLD